MVRDWKTGQGHLALALCKAWEPGAPAMGMGEGPTGWAG